MPDIPGFKTLKCDFHTHTIFSDGQVWPATRVSEAWREGLDAIAITDHVGFNPNNPDLGVNLKRPIALAAPLAARLGVLLVPGVELMQGDTHFNALFVSDPNAYFSLDMAGALREARKQHAFTFWNHPGWQHTAEWSPQIDALYKENLVDGVELVNKSSYYPQAFPWIGQKGLAILSDSDIHEPAPASYDNRGRPLTLVFARTADLAGLREALFAHRTAAWMGGDLWGNEEQLRELWEGAVGVENQTPACQPNTRQFILRLNNKSALHFHLRLLGAPAWLAAESVDLRPQSVAGVPVRLVNEAPGGEQAAELQFEVTNLHVAPGRNLSVRVPVKM